MPRKTTSWGRLLAKYEVPNSRKALGQVAGCFGAYFLLWVAMYASLGVSYWLTLVLAVPTAGFVVRIFIIQHDCGHRSLFRSARANDAVGLLCSPFTLTPFHHWRLQHNVHHAHSGSLDHRGLHYVTALTVEEYLRLPAWRKLTYRIYRNPFFMFGVTAPVYFLVINRYPYSCRPSWRRARRSVHGCNLALLGLTGAATLMMGPQAFLLIAVPVYLPATAIGFFLFYVQHQFEDTYYTRGEQWDHVQAALKGSSHFKLPKILQWFTGSIGLHHVHHMSPRIPNYNLQRCHDEIPAFQEVAPMTIPAALRTVALRFWDERQGRMVGLRHLRTLQL